MIDLTHLPSPAQSIILLSGVILVKALLYRISPHEPLRFFRFYCFRLANKVNNHQNNPHQQQIAGVIAAIITLLPIVIILSLFETLIEITLIWHALLLYLAIGGFSLKLVAKNIARSVTVNNKYQAKTLLAPQVLRDTDQLSMVGINKACIEMLVVRTVQQQFVVAAVFLLCGSLTALSFRLLLEMHYSWNIKQQRFFNFGQGINKIVNIVQWFPTRLFLLLQIIITLNHPITLYWRLIKKHFFKNNNSIVIHYLAFVLTVRLGGVAMYKLHKLRRLSFNDKGRQPHADDIINATKHIFKLQYSAIFLLFFALLMIISTN
jgi:adenosylcobinamide-phosphate synthase